MRVLLIEDSASLRRTIAAGLGAAGFLVDVAADGEEGLWKARQRRHDVLILDLMLPLLDGMALLQKIRAEHNDVRVLILSARDEVVDRIAGLDSGADDYLTKPFVFDELIARVRALVRRRYALHQDVIEVEGVRLDLRAHTVHVNDVLLELAPRERLLLELLMCRRGEVVGRGEIEGRIYDDLVQPMSNVVDAAVSLLRRQLREAGAPDLISTRRGLGYTIL